jgi:hypothetical protein
MKSKLKDLYIPENEYLVGTRLRQRLSQDGRVGYFKTDFINPDLLEPYEIIVTAHSDYPLNHQRFEMAPKNLKRWFARHATHVDTKLEGVPVGHQEPVTEVIGNLDPMHDISQKENIPQNLAYVCWRDSTYPTERKLARNLLKDKKWCTIDSLERSETGYRNYLQQMHSHKFTIAPRGHGAGSIRMWDALILRSIPVSLKAPEMRYFYDLPILFLDNWEQVEDREFLEQKYEEIMNTEYNLEKLTLSYWEKRILSAFHEESYDKTYNPQKAHNLKINKPWTL